MQQFRDGATQREAFEAVLQVDQDAFTDAFLEWAEGELVAWGMLAPPTMPDMDELVASLDDPAVAPGSHLETWLEQHPEHPQLLAARLEGLVAEAPDSPETIEIARRLANARPVATSAHRVLARHHLAEWEAGRSDGVQAIEHLEFLDAREVHSPTFATQLARLYASVDDWDMALRKAERATHLSPFDADYRELAASVAIRSQRLDRARHHIEALIRIEPDRTIHQRRLEALRQRGG